ncbi:phosphopantetheine-binding [Catenulispora acidiphila DSM 44928]|uniref:Phosphopantetheine-binding n=1 Tax=Catenulispora acidiphila (strain DSM 44928 / JCM 14897 / NBRC 102108 / NRRL B-24433 / ID139908) TaxID=479433 RepID=C7QAF4_CATAD|nr:acyl carrier protein [Catenulispora acidiphila]ACU72453.1 phosphopantetheine-binding [Catenulispora acidiphila DSM 44928]
MSDTTLSEFTLEDLKRVLLAAAGAPDGAGLDGDILDLSFEDLGYDSIALLETVGHVERERGLSLEDSVVAEANTPRLFLEFVNGTVPVARAS